MLIERVFGSIKTRLIDELIGSIDTVARSRELTSGHDPQRHAVWTLSSLSKLLERYLFESYPSMIHGELGTTPRDAFEFAMAHAGERIARDVPLDETLALALSETVPGGDGRRKVPKHGGGIRVCHHNFHHPGFSDRRMAGQKIPVRRCPADASFVYVLLPHKREWERAWLASGSIDLTHCSGRQARALIEENALQHLIASLPSPLDCDTMTPALSVSMKRANRRTSFPAPFVSFSFISSPVTRCARGDSDQRGSHGPSLGIQRGTFAR